MPGSYAAGSAGAILGTNLNAPVSSRSTYSGGAVAGVTAPVTVGVNNDKAGNLLGSSGLDAILIETGINPRQALSVILAWAAGVVSGANNRSSVTLTLPA